MRAVFGVLSLLMVVAIVGVLVKKQLSPASLQVAPAGNVVTLPAAPAGMTAPQQSQHIQQQMRESLDRTLQQTWPMPDEK